MGSGSKDLLTAVLRAEAGLDHYPATTEMADDEAATGDPQLAALSLTPNFGSNLKPAPLIIDCNPYEEYENDYQGAFPPQNRERGVRHRHEDSNDMEQQQRGRYTSTTSTRSQLTAPGVSPSTPARSATGQRRDGLGLSLGMGLASPLAQSYMGRARPHSIISTGGRRGNDGSQGQVHASNDDVLAALKRLESALASVAINTNKGGGTDGGKGTGKEGEKDKDAASASASDPETMLKELGERQTRIEALLLSLTREMRS